MDTTLNRIAFFLETPFHYRLFEPIIAEVLHLGFECELVINDFLQGGREWVGMQDALLRFLGTIKRDDIQAVPASLLLEHGLRYQCVVSPFFTSLLTRISLNNVRVMYALSKENWNFAWWNVFYDKICCFGPYDYARLNVYDNCVPIGNAQFDRWFSDELPDKEAITTRLGIATDRQTVLYAPTYGDLCSIDLWLPELIDLRGQYNVIVKLHHGTAHLQSEQNRRKAIHEAFDCVLDDSGDLLELLKVADYLVTDNSGVLFDGILSDKKIVLLETTTDSRLTNEQSAEQAVRRELLSLSPGQSLKDALADSQKFAGQAETRSGLIQRYFSHTDGKSSERAARVIADLFLEGTSGSNILLSSLRQRCFESGVPYDF